MRDRGEGLTNDMATGKKKRRVDGGKRPRSEKGEEWEEE